MKRFYRQLAAAFLGTLAFIVVLGYAGSYEYASIVVQSMSDVAYYTIVDKLGENCSERDIAEEYMSNKDYYDNLKGW